MQHLNEVVEHYLKIDTNYALMITGEWGVGKTFYFKNILSYTIKKTATFKNNSKKYEPLHISFFGLKSIEDIQVQIFLSLYPFFKDKKIKLATNAVKFLLKGASKVLPIGDLSEFLEIKDDITNELINFNDLVICFDDLERVSDNLNIEEFIGYVNSLVENENVKILIIANEDKIKSEKFKDYKEKVIGNVIEFEQDISCTYDSLLEIKFIDNIVYKKFLKQNKDYIIGTFNTSKNLRTLSFALTYYNRIFSELYNAKNEKFQDKIDEIFKILFEFTLAISIEYKEGKVSFKKREDLDDRTIDWANFNFGIEIFENAKNENKNDNKTYKESFIEKYYSGKNYRFFESVFNFVTGGSIFKIDQLTNELYQYYGISDNSIPIHDEILYKLSYTNVFSLSDKEYRGLTKEMLSYSDKGLYDLKDYANIFHFASRFENPLRYNIDNLFKRIVKGIKKGKLNYSYNKFLDIHLDVSKESEYYDILKTLIKLILEFNNELKNVSKQKDLEDLQKVCYSNFDEFNDIVFNKKREYLNIPIFKYFSSHNFYKFFLNSSGEVKFKIARFWESRYLNDFIHFDSKIKDEITFLESLKDRIETKIKKMPHNGLQSFLYKLNVDNLKKSLDKLNSIS